MSLPSLLKHLGIALFLITAGTQIAWSAVEQPEHNVEKKTESGLTLNNGELWPTDAHVRAGMTSIQRDIGESLPSIHSGSMTDKQYFILAKKIHRYVDDILQNCKLPPEADAQLHIVLSGVIKGALTMESQTAQASGAAMIVHALDQYARHFEHPNWKALTH